MSLNSFSQQQYYNDTAPGTLVPIATPTPVNPPPAPSQPSTPSYSSPGLNPGQQMMLNNIGQASYNFGYNLGHMLFAPTSVDPRIQQALTINQQGIDACGRSDWQTAINCFAQAAQLSPNDNQIRANLYYAYGADAFNKAALATKQQDTSTELADLRVAVANFGRSLQFVSNQYIQKDLSDAQQDLQQLEDALRRNKIAADLNGVLKLSGTPELGGLKLSGGPQLSGQDPNNPLELKITGIAQSTSAAGDSSGFDGGPGSALNTSAAAATATDGNLHPQGTSFFGLGGGNGNSAAPQPTGDPNVVDLRDAKTLTVDPAMVKGEASTMQAQGGAGVHQGTPDQLPPPNPTPQQTIASAQQPDANNPLGLKLSGTAQETSAAGNSTGFAGGNGSSVNYYQKSAGYTGPLTSPGPSSPSQGVLGSKLARFQGVIDAMYAADSSYTTNHYPPGYSILQIFTLVRDGTDAVLYGKMSDDGKPVNLILAFRGTDPSNPNDRRADEQNALGEKSQAYVSAALIARLVQKEFPNTPITISGHSLGGGEAALASVATGLPAITFNAAGVRPSDYGYSAAAETSQITNYNVFGETLTTAQNSAQAIVTNVPTALGKQIVVRPVTWPTIPLPTITGITGSQPLRFGFSDSNVGNHGMSAVVPAIINYLSQ